MGEREQKREGKGRKGKLNKELKYSFRCLLCDSPTCYVGDHILLEFNTLFLTRFRTHKIAILPQTKTWEGRRHRQIINTCRKVPLQVNFLDNDIWHCFLSVYSFYALVYTTSCQRSGVYKHYMNQLPLRIESKIVI